MMANRKAPLLGMPPNMISKIAAKQGFVPKTDAEKARIREQAKQAQIDLVRNALNVASPTSQSPSLRLNEEVDDAWAVLPVDAVHFYEHNPRKTSNSAFLELKGSIRVNGILQPLSVTKRPNESHYILFAGGNTRLQAIKALWEETGDAKFREARVITKAWRGEAAVLLAHMAENTQRNDMTFWDRACGTLEIKRQMEEETGVDLTFRDFEAALKRSGIQSSLQTISMYRFALDRLPEVGQWLSGLTVRTMQPKLNLLAKLAARHNIEADAFYSTVTTPVLGAFRVQIEAGEASFSSDVLVERWEGALAGQLELDGVVLKKMLTALERFPEMQLHELLRVCQPVQPEPNAGQVPMVRSQGTSHAPRAADTSRQSMPASGAGETKPGAAAPFQTKSSAEIPSIPSSTSEAFPSAHAFAPDDAPDSPEGELTLLTLCHRLMSEAGLASCYEEAEALPLGFYVGFPNDGPLDLKDQAESRQAAWWVIAMVTGQFDAELCRTALPDGSEWRSMILEDGSVETLGGLELSIQHNIGGQGEFLPIQWMLNPDNPVAGLALQILAVARSQGMMGGTPS